MNGSSGAMPFFLQAGQGHRFCLYYPPEPGLPVRGAILYVHPFAEELNKSRRMAALQARAFAARGYAVLQPDLYGCGDSSADFADARWAIWKQDLALAATWLEHETRAPVSLWGLRLGALLALDFASDAPVALAALLFWQPAFDGKLHLNQFLRMAIASQMFAPDAPAGSGTEALLQDLRRGKSLEVGGYTLAPELALAIAALDGANLALPDCPLHWLELLVPASGTVAAATRRLAEAWRSAGARVQVHPLRGVPFWATAEIVECPAMLAATASAWAP